MPAEQTTKLFIFDADGTLRRTTVPGLPSPRSPGEWELMPNVKNTLNQMDWNSGELFLGIASNQDGVSLGDLTKEMAYRLLQDMVAEAIGYFPLHTAIEMCTCRLGMNCRRKKPKPGMLLDIMHKFDIPPKQTLFVGDMEWDLEAARRAGVRFMWAKDFFGWGS